MFMGVRTTASKFLALSYTPCHTATNTHTHAADINLQRLQTETDAVLVTYTAFAVLFSQLLVCFPTALSRAFFEHLLGIKTRLQELTS